MKGKDLAASNYTARHLSVLEGLEAVRKRPGMYIGSTDSRGLMHCLWEIIDNSVDEALAGYGQSIQIILHRDGSVEVQDDGRGIPTDIEPRTGLSGLEVVFTKLHAGGKFGGGSYTASGGLHGVGASVVNALSSRLDVQVDRGSKTYQMSFRHGMPGRFDSSRTPKPEDTFTPAAEGAEALQIVGRAKRGVTGTRVRYWADPQIFTPDARFSYEDLVSRARQTSFLIPGLRIAIRDERRVPGTPGEFGPHEEVFQHDGGISEFVEFLAHDSAVTDIWRFTGRGSFTETVPVLGEDGRSQLTDVERECEVDIALRWGIGYETTIRSFVNIIATPKGGTHTTGFEQGLLRTFRKHLADNARRFKVGNDKIEKDDALAGLTAVLTASRLVASGTGTSRWTTTPTTVETSPMEPAAPGSSSTLILLKLSPRRYATLSPPCTSTPGTEAPMYTGRRSVPAKNYTGRSAHWRMLTTYSWGLRWCREQELARTCTRSARYALNLCSPVQAAGRCRSSLTCANAL